MDRRITRGRRPNVEQCERRELLSAITDIMASRSQVGHGTPDVGSSQALAQPAPAVSPRRAPRSPRRTIRDRRRSAPISP